MNEDSELDLVYNKNTSLLIFEQQ